MKRSPYEWAEIIAIYLVILIVTGFLSKTGVMTT